MMLEEKQLKQAVMSFLEQAFNEDSAFKDNDVALSQFFIMVTYCRQLSNTRWYLLVYHILELKHSNRIFRDTSLYNTLTAWNQSKQPQCVSA